jgi:ABC-type multidrug transport system fused ATPase/permease subunit
MDWNRFLAVSGSVENITSFEKEMRSNKEINGRTELNGSIQSMELQNISFNYGDKIILQNIDLKIFNRQTIGIVGESGSGKTTLVNIITGLFPVNEGQYFINDINSNKLNLKTIQKKIGYITQDANIFNDTLYNNVTFWADKTEENIIKFWRIINKVALNEFIISLPNQENEILGHNGINLSGGQKQRISIARELYKEVEILILDEATSALDSETERMIQKNIENLYGEYTILIVAHRIPTIKNADKIVIMKDRQIIGIGSFDYLIKESPYFSNMVRLQKV